jgi:hypothetical protein
MENMLTLFTRSSTVLMKHKCGVASDLSKWDRDCNDNAG